MMKVLRTRPLALAAISLAALPMTAQAKTVTEKAQAELAQLLEGRVAGTPQDCIFMPSAGDSLRVLHGTALVFGRGKTIYVNYTQDPDSIDRSDTFVFRRTASRLCDTDSATTSQTGTYTGNVMLEEFIPYTRP